MKKTPEVWKNVERYVNYQVSTKGQVRNTFRKNGVLKEKKNKGMFEFKLDEIEVDILLELIKGEYVYEELMDYSELNGWSLTQIDDKLKSIKLKLEKKVKKMEQTNE